VPSQPASNSSNNDDNKEKDAMLRRVMQDMNSNNDYDNTLDEAGRRERKLGWWNGGSHFGSIMLESRPIVVCRLQHHH